MARTDQGAATTAEQGATSPAEPAAETKAAKEKTQEFAAVFKVVASAGTFAPGEKAKLTRAEWETLSALGAIEGEWK
ncbi:hypothetical protein LG047_12575 [Methylocystis sp. WRRC1]|uniref:hypothetical protein n=1 Tax=unclassified Methylocystis TaxID=2625913 RepID=UPI0001F86A8F|nr:MULTISPECIES: hypothetical protein [unclassified Methylocystis]MCC3246144.1 hypothetical protein [Methylocystis sp. WRRC1]